MAWRYHGRARVDPNYPEAAGICDRCGLRYQLNSLRYQFEWRGPRLANTRLRVCSRCMDIPFIFNKPIIFPPDPKPVPDPRPQNFTVANNGSPVTPALPWPVQQSGPPQVAIFLLDDDGNVLLDDGGHPILADASPNVIDPPVYETPPLPPLPPDIQWTYSEP